MNLEKILRFTVIAGIFVLPVIPLIVSNFLFFPFITGKVFVFRLIIEIIFFSWLCLVFLNKEYLPKKSWLLGSILAFIAAIFLADIFGVDPYRSFWSSFERMEGFFTILHLGAFFIVAVSILDRKLWRIFFHVSLAISVTVSFYSFFQLTGKLPIRQGDVRVDGTFGNAIYLAAYLLFHIFIALFYFFRSQNKYRYAYLAVIALELVIIYFTATRGAILGLIGGLIVTSSLILFFEKERKFLRRGAGIILAAVLLIIGGFVISKDADFVKSSSVLSRFSDLSFEGIKSQARYYIWPMAIEGFKERPVLGYGQENFIHVFNKNYNPVLFDQEPWFDRVHNIFLDWLIAGGILGLTAFLIIILSLFFTLWRSDSFSIVDKSVLTGLLSAYLFQGLFVFDNLTSYIMFFSIAAFVAGSSSDSRRSAPALDSPKQNIKYAAVSASLIIAVISAYFLNIKPLLANRTLLLAIHPDTRLDISLNRFEKVFDYNTFGSYEALLQLLNKTTKVVKTENMPIEIKNQFLDTAQRNIEIQTSKFPDDGRLSLIVGSFYNSLGLYEKALNHLLRSKELSPRRQEVYFALGSLYYETNETEKAKDSFERALELEPRNPEAITKFIAAALLRGDFKEAEAMIEAVDKNIYYNDNSILNAFVAAKQYDRVLDIWQTRVENDPENPKIRQSLTAIYLKLEQWDKAIAEIEKTIELDPSFKEMGEGAINEIRSGRGSSLIADE